MDYLKGFTTVWYMSMINNNFDLDAYLDFFVQCPIFKLLPLNTLIQICVYTAKNMFQIKCNDTKMCMKMQQVFESVDVLKKLSCFRTYCS